MIYVPMLFNIQTPLRWIESFKDCLYRYFGVRCFPLLYTIQNHTQVPDNISDPLQDWNWILILRLCSWQYDFPPKPWWTLVQVRKQKCLIFPEEASRSAVYAPMLKPFEIKSMEKAWLSMISSHSRYDKWEKLQNDKLKLLMNTECNGYAYRFENFIGFHRS